MNYHFDVISRRGELSTRTLDLWKGDLELLRNCGFTGVVSNVVLWGDGKSGIAPYDPVDVQRKFMDTCRDSGLTVMLAPPLMRIPSVMSQLPDEMEYAAVDMYGRRQSIADVYDPLYRMEWLDPFLKKIIHLFGRHPAMESYAFGDYFVGYGSGFSARNRLLFGEFLQRKYGKVAALNKAHGAAYRSFRAVGLPSFKCPWTQLWKDFTEARRDWLVDYVRDLNRSIRRYDRNPAHRIPFSVMSWDLFQDKNDFGGISSEYLASCDVALSSLNFPSETYPRSLARTLTDWIFSTLREVCPRGEIGVGDIPGVRNRRWDGAGIFPPAREVVALLEQTLRYGANWFIVDGHRKSLQQTAVAYHQVYAFHKRELAGLGAFFKSLV